MTTAWMRLMARFLVLGVVEGEGDPPPEGDELPPGGEEELIPPGDDETPPGDDELPPEGDEPPLGDQPPAETRGKRAIRESRKRAQDAEARATRAEAEARAATQRSAPPPPPTDEQRLFEQEEALLRAPDCNEWTKWKIGTDRQNRQIQRTAQQTLAQAQDTADRADFARMALTKPKLYAYYADKVEERLKQVRANGGNVPRDMVFTLLLGEDAKNGKLKSKARDNPPPAVNRAKPGAPRTDIRTRGTLSERQKLAKRLEGVQI